MGENAMQRLLNVIACAIVGLVAVAGLAIYLTQPPAGADPFATPPTGARNAQQQQRVVVQRPQLNDDLAAKSSGSQKPAAVPAEPPRKYSLAEVEAELDRLRANRKERPEASDELVSWYERLASPSFTQSRNYADHIAELTKWREESPQSPTPLIALARSNTEYAWEARGSGYASTVTEDGGKLFAERIATARELLEKAIELGAKDGEAYASLITVGMAQGWPLSESQTVLGAGRKLDPLYYRLYTAMAVNLLPRWNGEPGEVEKLAIKTATELGGDDGLEACGRIAASIDCLDRTLIYWGDFDSQQLAAAGRVLIDRHPKWPYCVAYGARFAWIGDDRETAQKARALLKGTEIDLKVWGLESRLKEFERWCDSPVQPDESKAQVWGSLTGVSDLAFAPNTRYVWCNTSDREVALQLIDTQSGKPRTQLRGLGGGIGKFSFQPSQNLLVAVGTSGAVVWHVKYPLRPLPIPTENRCFSVAASPAEPLVAVHDGKQVKLISLGKPDNAKTLEASDEFVNHLMFSADGKQLAVHARQALSVWNVETAEKQYELPTYDANPRPEVGLKEPFFFDKENRLLAVGLRKRATHPLIRYAADGAAHEVLGELPMSNFLTLSPDGNLVALLPQGPPSPNDLRTIEIWDIRTNKLRHRLSGHTSQIHALVFSADSKQLATGSNDGRVKIWDVTSAN
jgi:WD40 repeat protein